jgi:hypothetical protein
MGKVIPQTSSCKHLGIFLRSDLSWADQVNYTVKKAWKALHFTMRILKMANSNTRSLAYRSLVQPILEFGLSFLVCLVLMSVWASDTLKLMKPARWFDFQFSWVGLFTIVLSVCMPTCSDLCLTPMFLGWNSGIWGFNSGACCIFLLSV